MQEAQERINQRIKLLASIKTRANILKEDAHKQGAGDDGVSANDV
jgi:hypothetical protein